MDRIERSEKIIEEGLKNNKNSFKKIGFDLSKLKKNPRKIDFSYQALGLEMRNYFSGEREKWIWSLFYKKWSEEQIRDAFEICKKKNRKDLKYLIGILNNK